MKTKNRRMCHANVSEYRSELTVYHCKQNKNKPLTTL